MFSRVVLATDFSEHSVKSYAVGQALAKRFDSKLFVLHVVQTSHWTTYAQPLAELDLEHEVAVHVAEALESVRQRFAAEGIDAVVRHRLGDPRLQIVQFAREVSAHAILIASHGHGGLYERLLGGTTDRVVRRSGVPVLVASGHMPADAAFGFDRVLFPTDLSAESVHHAEALVEGLGPRLLELHLLHVVQPQVFLPVFPGAMPVAMSTEGLDQANRLADKRLEAARARLARSRADLRVVAEMQFGGSVPAAIIDYRAKNDLKLIAVPASRQSAQDPHYLGRTAEALLTKAHVPVLVLK
jgi:nucleotide-binding universal stress UspA family protein